jgi:hypothetical protein
MLTKPGHKVTSRVVPWDSAAEILSFFDMEHQEEAVKKRKTHKAWIPLESNPEVLNKVLTSFECLWELFQNAYDAVLVCPPARTSLVMGLHRRLVNG